MKKLFFIFIVLVLLGCPEDEESSYRVYYNSNGATEGSPPTDPRFYRAGDTVTILDKGNLKRNDYTFVAWSRESGYNTNFIFPGDKLTINRDINLYAVWDDSIGLPFSFKIENDEAIITKCNEISIRTVSIPNTFQGKPVVAIDNTVFSSLSITTVNLGNIKRIGIAAFSNNRIPQILIPDSVESIGVGAFRDNLLTKVTLGEGLTELGAYAFGSNQLYTIAIPENIKTIGVGAFMGNTIRQITIGSDVDIKNDDSFGTHGASFRTFYDDGGKLAGLYLHVENDVWEKVE